MADATPRVLTHHINIRNPESGEVGTFEPQDGANLPAWAHKALVAEDHAAYPEQSPRALALVRSWEASKLAAEAALMAQEG